MDLTNYIKPIELLKNQKYFPSNQFKELILSLLPNINENFSLYGKNIYHFLLNKKDINELKFPIQVISSNPDAFSKEFVSLFCSKIEKPKEKQNTIVRIIEGSMSNSRTIEIASSLILDTIYFSKDQNLLINKEVLETNWGELPFVIGPFFLMNDFYLSYIQPSQRSEWINLLKIEEEWNEQFIIEKTFDLKNKTIENKNKKNSKKQNAYFERICLKIQEFYNDFIITGSWAANQMNVETGEFNAILVKDSHYLKKKMIEIFGEKIQIDKIHNDNNYFGKSYYCIIKINDKEVNFLIHELSFTFNFYENGGFKRTNFHGTILYFLYLYYNSWDKPILKLKTKEIIEKLWIAKNQYFKINVEETELDNNPFQVFQIKNQLGNYFDWLNDRRKRIFAGKLMKAEKYCQIDTNLFIQK